MKNILDSKKFRYILIGIVSAIVLLVIFQLGVFVGYHKAAFSYRYGENYYRNFESGLNMFGNKGSRGIPGVRDMRFENLPGGHGAIGKIIRISLPTVVVAGPDNIEKIIHIATSTSIRRFHDTVASTDLHIDDSIVVIGIPNDAGEVEAKLIRVVPEPSMGTSTIKASSATSSITSPNKNAKTSY